MMGLAIARRQGTELISMEGQKEKTNVEEMDFRVCCWENKGAYL